MTPLRTKNFRPVATWTAAALIAALLALSVGACSKSTSMDPIKADPGISASLRVVEAKTDALFAELERNAAAPFSEYDAIHYRPLLDELNNAVKLTHLHKRPSEEKEALSSLQATYDSMRQDHRQNRLNFSSLRDFRERLANQMQTALALARR